MCAAMFVRFSVGTTHTLTTTSVASVDQRPGWNDLRTIAALETLARAIQRRDGGTDKDARAAADALVRGIL